MKGSRRFLIGGAVASSMILTTLGLLVSRPAHAANKSSPIVVGVGDLIQVAGTHVSCGVVQRAGATMIQCLGPSPLRKTYGTLMGDRKVVVVRFRNDTVAKIVFTATQKRSFSTCSHGT